MDGLYATNTAIHRFISIVCCPMHYLWVGGVDPWFNRHGSQLSIDCDHRYNFVYKDGSIVTMSDEDMTKMIDQLDEVIKQYAHCEAHNIAGILLSRVTLLMTMDTSTGKELLRYVWEKLDEIEQADPSNLI